MKTQSLTEMRARIDALDDQLIALLIQRIETSNSIMKSKAPAQIVDSAREQEILARYSQKLSGVSTPIKTKRLVAALLAASNLYPEHWISTR